MAKPNPQAQGPIGNGRIVVQFHVEKTTEQNLHQFKQMVENLGNMQFVTLEHTSVDFPVSAALVGSEKVLIAGDLADTVGQAQGAAAGQFQPVAPGGIVKGS